MFGSSRLEVTLCTNVFVLTMMLLTMTLSGDITVTVHLPSHSLSFPLLSLSLPSPLLSSLCPVCVSLSSISIFSLALLYLSFYLKIYISICRKTIHPYTNLRYYGYTVCRVVVGLVFLHGLLRYQLRCHRHLHPRLVPRHHLPHDHAAPIRFSRHRHCRKCSKSLHFTDIVPVFPKTFFVFVCTWNYISVWEFVIV